MLHGSDTELLLKSMSTYGMEMQWPDSYLNHFDSLSQYLLCTEIFC